MSRAIVAEALDLIGEAWQMPEDRALDADGCIVLRHDSGLDVMLTYVPPPSEAVVIYAELGAVENAEPVFRQALEAMHLWQAGDNLTLGVLPGTDELTACMSAPAGNDLLHDLSPMLDHFAERALVWVEIAAGGPADLDQAAASDEPGDGAVWG